MKLLNAALYGVIKIRFRVSVSIIAEHISAIVSKHLSARVATL